MVYVNCAARHGGVKTAAPRMTPRQIDDARTAAAEALAAAKHPETGSLLFPQIIETAEAYQIDPAREGYPDLIALPDEPYWVRTKLTSSTAWVEPDANLPGTHRPEGIVALAGAGLPTGRNLKAHLIDVTPTILALLGLPIPAHIEGKPIVGSPTPAESTPTFAPSRHDSARRDPRRPSSQAVRILPPRSKRSSSSASPTWATWSDRSSDGCDKRILDRQIKSSRRRGVCDRLHAEHTPVIRNRWPVGTKAVRQAHRVAQLQDLVVAELDDPVARRAVQVIVGRVAVVVLERAAIGQPQLAEQPGFDQQPQRPIDRRAADLVTGVVQVANQLVGIEVLVGIEDMTDQDPPGLGQLLAADLQEFAEFLDRRLRNRHGSQLIALRFRHDSDPRTSSRSPGSASELESQIDNDSSL